MQNSKYILDKVVTNFSDDMLVCDPHGFGLLGLPLIIRFDITNMSKNSPYKSRLIHSLYEHIHTHYNTSNIRWFHKNPRRLRKQPSERNEMFNAFGLKTHCPDYAMSRKLYRITIKNEKVKS